MSTNHFHVLTIQRVSPEAEGSVCIAFSVPAEKRALFDFQPGQYLTLRAQINDQEVRRSYSICCARSHFQRSGELEVGIRAVEGGLFSNWAVQHLQAGDTIEVMPPQGRFTVRKQRAIHRVGFAAGSGITPVLSIAASTLEEQAGSKFTLVYGNRRMSSVMFNEALQDLKDRYPDRLTLIHVLSRQAQEVPLLQGRIDADKVKALMNTLLPARSMDEIFICGPESMIVATEQALINAGVPAERICTERFASGPRLERKPPADAHAQPGSAAGHDAIADAHSLSVILDGKAHELSISADDHLLDAALEAGLDLPFSCKAGVCCTCRAKVLEGETVMDKNFTLEADEIARGYVLSCQARALSKAVCISFDER
jgi:ring-1,2-phenylacetyl-CoA epoxidase subunit PaaE